VVNAVSRRGVKNVAIYGYSWGGGATYNLSAALKGLPPDIGNLFSVCVTGYIDAVALDGGKAEGRRPPLTDFHVGQYTTNYIPDALWRGGTTSKGDDDIDRAYLGVNHYTIDDNDIVQEFLIMRIEQKLPSP
jgi:hypothetical protein